MQTPEIKVSANIIAFQNGKVLLGIRLNTAGHGDWAFPGGHLEFGENIQGAAKREFLEETGLEISQMEYVGVINQPSKDVHYIHFVFRADDIVGDPKVMEPESCQEWKWFGLDEIPENFFFAHKKFIDTLESQKTLIEEKS